MGSYTIRREVSVTVPRSPVEDLVPALFTGQLRQRVAVRPGQPRELAGQSQVVAERGGQQLPEGSRVPLAVRDAAAVRGAHGGAVEAGEQEPARVLRGDVELRAGVVLFLDRHEVVHQSADQ